MQGLGNHGKGDVQRAGIEDLQAVSTILGDKDYILGDRPSDVDCTLFGFMCIIMDSDDSEDSIYKVSTKEQKIARTSIKVKYKIE